MLGHARRKFHEAHKATGSPLAQRVVRMVKDMYAVEASVQNLPPEQRAAVRTTQTLPILNKMRAELEASAGKAQGVLKTAINYTLKAFEDLQRFVFDGRLEIDNNPVERCIRPIALSKKNSLFAGSAKKARVWAICFTLLETAKLNNVDPRSYVSWVCQQIQAARGHIDHATLMPWHCPVGRRDDA